MDSKYVSKRFNCEISFPSEKFAISNDSAMVSKNISLVLWLTEREPQTGQFVPNVNFLCEKMAGELSIEKYVELTYSSYKEQFESFEIFSESISGNQANLCYGTVKDNTQLKYFQRIIFHDKKVYIATGTCSSEQEKVWRPEFQELLQGFTFLTKEIEQ